MLRTEGIIAFMAGEFLVCPDCGEDLVLFLADYPEQASIDSVEVLEAVDLAASYHPGRWVCRCGGMPTRPLASEVSLPADAHLFQAEGPRAFIRSGSWVGWRGLGE